MTTLEAIEILVRIAWLVGAVAFVIGLARMNSPATARNGNLVSAGGMVVAISATAILILARQRTGWGGRRAALLGIAAFTAVAFTFVWMNVFALPAAARTP